MIIIGGGIGFLNGVLTYRLQGQALIMTLGRASPSPGWYRSDEHRLAFSGNVFGTVPPWLPESRGDEW